MVQKKAAKFAHQTNSSNWETLTSCRKLSRMCALFKAYSEERAWRAIGDSLQRPHYLQSVDHERKIRCRRQRTDIRKYSFVNRLEPATCRSVSNSPLVTKYLEKEGKESDS
jgi:hypothetical protein